MFTPISNPYIVGNPIKTKKMFYGREDDFEFIRRKLESGTKSYIIVLSGERRSGKTSILFQILNGELGQNFIPILIDMQTMAGLKNEAEFFEKFAQETVKHLDHDFKLEKYNFLSANVSPYRAFSQLLDDIHTVYPDKNKLFLIDEYELIEIKSSEGSLSPNFVPFLSGILESEKHISFVFTGSRTLEQRGNNFWQNLFGKSLFRNVSFLSEQDTRRLITQPVDGQISFDPPVFDTIYRLTAGQPFYTQIVGQNIVDFVNENERTHITLDDLNYIVNEILENPLPQMIYFWNSLPQGQMLMLSLLAEILESPQQMINAREIIKQIKKKKLGIELDAHLINTILESLYHLKYVQKADGNYCFQIDLMRQWIKRDHSIWRVMKEVDLESILANERSSSISQISNSSIRRTGSGMKWVGIAAALIVAGAAGGWYLFLNADTPAIPEIQSGSALQNQAAEIRQTDPADQSEITKNEPAATAEEPTEKIVKPSMPVATNKNPENRSAERESSPEVSSTRALDLRDQADKARIDAEQLNAPVVAAETFRIAKGFEDEAHKHLASGDIKLAEIKYTEAIDLYTRASSTSKDSEQEMRNQLLKLAEENQKIINKLQSEHRSLNIYREAEALRTESQALADARNYAGAIEKLNRSSELYNSAIIKRNEDRLAIENAIRDYSKAIETKNITSSNVILSSYKSELEDEWSPFFKVANDIKLNLTMQTINFNAQKASVRVDGVLSYSGAGGSGNSNAWNFDLIEESETWLISRISEAK